MRTLSVALVGILILVAASALATIFGTVKGVVHDAQHRPVPGATVTVKASRSDWSQFLTSGAEGTFELQAVPVGDYAVTATLQGFDPAQQAVAVISGSARVLHLQLEVAGVSESVTVSGGPEAVQPRSMTPTTLVTRQDIEGAPGADRTNSLETITAFVPGAYVTHDQPHVRGGHQVSWLIDGVPVPNTNIASNVGPQFDPKDIDVLEVLRGSYGAEYGDRTCGVFNVVPRTGFERNSGAEVVTSFGSFDQTNDQVSAGGHTQRFAYFASGNFNRSTLGLGTPTAGVLHDRESGGGGFASFILNVDPSNQLRVVASVRRNLSQIPNTPDSQAAGIDDVERESDALVNVSWVRTFRSKSMLTVSPFYHYNTANDEGGPRDHPIGTTDERTSQYVGAQATFSADIGKHSVEVGFCGFHQWDDQLFGLVFDDGSNPNFSMRERPSGNTAAVLIQDKAKVTSWLTISAGLRQMHFSGAITENATSPRVGATVQIPSLGWTLRGFYGRFYQEPPLITASGPLVEYVTAQNLGFIPLRGERDVEYQAGLAVPLRGWTMDADRFQTRATNYFDHNPIGNSNIFFPVTIDGALIRGPEITVRSPRTW